MPQVLQTFAGVENIDMTVLLVLLLSSNLCLIKVFIVQSTVFVF